MEYGWPCLPSNLSAPSVFGRSRSLLCPHGLKWAPRFSTLILPKKCICYLPARFAASPASDSSPAGSWMFSCCSCCQGARPLRTLRSQANLRKQPFWTFPRASSWGGSHRPANWWKTSYIFHNFSGKALPLPSWHAVLDRSYVLTNLNIGQQSEFSSLK